MSAACVCSLLAMAAAGAAASPPDADDGILARGGRPDILFVLIDDFGINDAGFHNRSADGAVAGRGLVTPNLDGLADGGLRLTSYYVQEMCTPTRAALMTGRYPHRYGITGYTIGAAAPWGLALSEPPLLPARLRDGAGYTTFMTGKWHLGFFQRAYLPHARGFERVGGTLLNAQADHYTHTLDHGYDWHELAEAPRAARAAAPLAARPLPSPPRLRSAALSSPRPLPPHHRRSPAAISVRCSTRSGRR